MAASGIGALVSPTVVTLAQTPQLLTPRGVKPVVVASEGDKEIGGLAEHVITVPPAVELLLPLLEAVPLQLFSYHFAVLNGANVDSPRNLVKAVVTE